VRVAIASGKGGTGKTTLATSLAVALAGMGVEVTYADFDVEEPNGHILLRPDIEASHAVEVPTPVVHAPTCTLCGRCAEVCQYHALACLPDRVLVFPEICHGCGACVLACPAGAISEVGRRVGTIRSGRAGDVRFLEGELSVGEAAPTPVVRALRARLPEAGFVIMDAPPGTSCPVVETLRAADRVILITEPTPFGLSDLRLAVDVTTALSTPVAVVVNRSDIGGGSARAFCDERGLPIVAEIPNDRAVAEAYARGVLPALRVPAFARAIERVAGVVRGWAEGERAR